MPPETSRLIHRKAVLADVPALVDLEQAFPLHDRFSRRAWARLITGHTIVLIAEDDTGCIAGAGVVLLRKGTDIARLYSLAVSPAWRGKGVAAGLLAALEQAAGQAGSRRMRLEVRASNSRAIQIYEAGGYAVLGELHNYYPDGEKALKMEKFLREEQRSAQ